MIPGLSEVKKIVSHDSCSDGLASAMICRDALPAAEVQFIQYGTDEREALPAEPGMLFVDMTPPATRVKEFIDVGAIVLDHHKGAEALVKSFGERGVFADEKKNRGVAGAMLAYRHVWEHLSNPSDTKPIKNLAFLVSIRDTWQKQHPQWEEAQAVHSALMFFPREMWLNNPFFGLEERYSVGRIAYQQRMEKARRTASKAHRLEVKGRRIAVFMDGEHLVSDVSDLLDVDLVAGFFYEEGPRIVYSLRTRSDLSCADFAKSYGGGGHTKAAGFSVELGDDDFQPFTLFRQLAEGYFHGND